ncbi:MAG TPA: lipopolysaccharide kinase InaA family protein [Gemmata sp.]|nr:lipopolysaccharide kinase InaA family protein [Gemmata sp.]
MQPRKEPSAIGSEQVVYRPTSVSTGGWVELNPEYISGFKRLGLDSPDGFLELPGEVVSGHPDRHVVRVQLPGFLRPFYLKRQHCVKWREKLRNWRAGFGWVSRSERECSILKQLARAGLSCPRWAAVGVDGHGRAFLLVEELTGAVDLRQFMNDTDMSQTERAIFAQRLGQWIALFHDSGFTTPELTAKHLFVDSATREFSLIDWQSGARVPNVTPQSRLRFLTALHASLAEPLAKPLDRLRVLRGALRNCRQEGQITGRFSDIVRRILSEAKRLADRRSIRDQRQHPAAVAQRLVWIAGEAVCAVPDVAAIWPNPAIATPFYGCEPGTLPIQLPDGREALLVRGRSFAPIGFFHAWARGRIWRSPGVTVGRVLFHLERYGIAAPRLLAFGQRFTGRITSEWFALHTPPDGPIIHSPDFDIAAQLGRMLRRLHDAGCSAGNKPFAVFGLDKGSVCIRDPLAIRIAKPDTDSELRCFLATLPPSVREAAEMSYRSGQEPVRAENRHRVAGAVNRRNPAEVIQ